jgi:hypothetical protein
VPGLIDAPARAPSVRRKAIGCSRSSGGNLNPLVTVDKVVALIEADFPLS